MQINLNLIVLETKWTETSPIHCLDRRRQLSKKDPYRQVSTKVPQLQLSQKCFYLTFWHISPRAGQPCLAGNRKGQDSTWKGHLMPLHTCVLHIWYLINRIRGSMLNIASWSKNILILVPLKIYLVCFPCNKVASFLKTIIKRLHICDLILDWRQAIKN